MPEEVLGDRPHYAPSHTKLATLFDKKLFPELINSHKIVKIRTNRLASFESKYDVERISRKEFLF